MIIMLLLRFIMDRENKRRDTETRDTSYDEVYIERVNSDGNAEKVRVDKVRIASSVTVTDHLGCDAEDNMHTGIFGSYRYSESRLSLRIVIVWSSRDRCEFLFRIETLNDVDCRNCDVWMRQWPTSIPALKLSFKNRRAVTNFVANLVANLSLLEILSPSQSAVEFRSPTADEPEVYLGASAIRCRICLDSDENHYVSNVQL
jgi:hypothetical protein